LSSETLGIIDPFHPRIVDVIRAAVPAEWTVVTTQTTSEEDRAAALASADVAFVMAAPMPGRLLRKAPRLRFIQKLGAGIENIDCEYCREAGIGVARLQAGNNIPVAEHTLLLMLAACRQLPRLDAGTRAGEWDKEAVRSVNRQIHGKTVGIVGFGAVGRQVAHLLANFGARLIYYDPRRATPQEEAAYGIEFRQLDDVISASDILTLHAPLQPDTVNLINADRLRAMKRGAILVNAARGGLVDEDELLRVLQDGHLFGAGIDVFLNEPPLGSPLLGLGNTVVTPHSAGGTIDNFATVAARSVENAKRSLAGLSIPEDDLVLPVRREAMA